jgi:hypothetical protein
MVWCRSLKRVSTYQTHNRPTAWHAREGFVPVLEFRPRGVMEYWSVGVVRQVRIAPRDPEVGHAFRGVAAVVCQNRCDQR